MSNNPYESPLAIQQSNIGPWEIALVERLIAGDATEEWHLYDTSDLQFMGHRKRQALRNEMEKRAIESGCEPIVFQTTLWRCFLFIPILPKGAYAVIPKIVFDGTEDGTRYRAVRVRLDWFLVTRYYALCVFLFLVLLLVTAWYWLSDIVAV